MNTSRDDQDEVLVDEGFRRWYASCSCCLSESYPEVKATLDDEASRQAEEKQPS